MPRAEWDTDGSHFFETGIDRGMLYVGGGDGVAWNGLVKVSETSTGGAAREFFVDGDKYLNLPSLEEYVATIEAVSAPKDFAPCEGKLQWYPGMYVTNQPPKAFGFSYRTMIGNDLDGVSSDYKIHVVYNAIVKAADVVHQTISKNPNMKTYSWSVSSVPEPFIDYKPSAHFVIDTRKETADTVLRIENILYGTDTTDPRMPTVADLMNILVMATFSGGASMKKMRLAGTGKGTAKVISGPKMKKMRLAGAGKGISKVTAGPKMKKMKVSGTLQKIAKATGGPKMKKMTISAAGKGITRITGVPKMKKFAPAGTGASTGNLSVRSATAAATSSSSTTLTPAMPAGWAPGDLLVIVCGFSAGTNTVSQTGGTGTWTIASTDGNTSGGGPFTSFVAYRVMTAGNTAPTFTFSVSSHSWYTLIALKPAAGKTAAIDVISAVQKVTANTTLSVPSLTAASPSSVSLIMMAMRHFNTGVITSMTVVPPATHQMVSGAVADYFGTASLNSEHARGMSKEKLPSGAFAPAAVTWSDSSGTTSAANLYHIIGKAT